MGSLRRRLVLAAVAGFAAVAAASAANAAPAPADRTANQRFFDFAAGRAEPSWFVRNDTVMGGVSSSQAAVRNGVLTFSGSVRLENDGGFASAAADGSFEADEALASASSVRLRVRGDRRTYQLTIRSQGIWYWGEFTVQGTRWQTVELPYSVFRPHGRFGAPISAAPYAGRRADEFSLLISNKKAERFRLEVDWIDAPGRTE